MSTPIGTYEMDYTLKTLSFLQSDTFKKAIKLIGEIEKSKRDNVDFINACKEGWADKYKTVDDVRKYIGSLGSTINKQEEIITELANRNKALADFVVKNALGDKIRASDMIELTDGYRERIERIEQSLKITEQKPEYEKIDDAIKKLMEPDYSYEYPEEY